VLQFPYFNREAFPSAGSFLERLDAFLGALPKDRFRYGVEVRNRAWVGRPLRDLCAKHRAILVLVDQAWMPHGDEVARRLDPITTDLAYVRLLGDREEIERVTKTWEKEVLDRGDRLERWARLLVSFMDRNVKSLVYANNHYAGHGPATVRRLMARFAELAAEPRPAAADRQGNSGIGR
jgi:uncharacterized protein YecE (DUF72 family)